MIVVVGTALRVQIPSPFPTGEALDRALKLPRWAPLPIRRFLRKRGVADPGPLQSGADRISLWAIGNHTRFARTESVAVALKATDTALMGVALFRARLLLEKAAPSSATWSEDDATELANTLATCVREAVDAYDRGPGAFPAFEWLPPQAIVTATTARARADAVRMGFAVAPDGVLTRT